MYREAMYVGRVQGTKFPAGVWGRAPSVTRFTRFSWMGLIPVLLKKSLSVSLNLSLTERGRRMRRGIFWFWKKRVESEINSFINV